ncbi:MAG TPA: hypothetical protein PK042_08350 [Usitatibacteraceae bacterium]|nr:hypothetical protein [Usitatibacteraceae bacterium]
MLTQRIAWIVWPAFLVACAMEVVFFTLFDPADLNFFGRELDASRMTIYSVGFFAFWGIGAASSFLTCFLQRSPWEVNRCPLPATQRPPGCPKREDDASCGS